MEENELLAVRRQKLQQLIEKNWTPFGGRFDVSGTIEEIRQGFVEGRKVALAGRITAHRNMGKSQFVDLSDLTGRMQVYLNLKELPPEQAELFGLVDIGDFLGVTGETFVTKTGEPTVRAESFRLLSKTLRPLPDKWHGVTDVEIRYRQRYLDLIANPESRRTFLIRSRVLREIRQFFYDRGFITQTQSVLPMESRGPS
jgi:lysyl-tRNA synthetase, class II